MPIFHYPKGSPEAKAHMARLRAMRDAKRAANPLTRKEQGSIKRVADMHADASHDERLAGKLVQSAHSSGKAIMAASIASHYGPKKLRRNPLTVEEHEKLVRSARKAFEIANQYAAMPGEQARAAGLYRYAQALSDAIVVAGARVPDRQNAFDEGRQFKRHAERAIGADHALHDDLRKRNSPMLVLGNPATERKAVALKKNPDGSFEALVRRVAKSPGPNLPAELLAHPRFKRELRAYIKRHGAGPIEVKIVNAPDGYPYVASSWGKSPNVVYDAPRHSNKGKRIHHFGEGGGKKPDLISSVEKGPKFLAFVDGTFRADGEWILK